MQCFVWMVQCPRRTLGAFAVPSIDFHREGESLEAAIRSAIADVQKAGCTVTQVTLEADSLAALSCGCPLKILAYVGVSACSFHATVCLATRPINSNVV